MFVTRVGKGIYSLTDVFDRGGVESTKRLARKDVEPYLDLVQPGSMGGNVVEMNTGVLRQPPVMFRLMGIEVIKDNMQFLVRIKSNGLVHEVQELSAAAETGAIVTAEEHLEHGGLGSEVARVVTRRHPVPVEMVAMKDTYAQSGKPAELMKRYGLTAKDIELAVKLAIARG